MTERVLVTGASAGIGAGIVQALSEAGMAVHAVARRANRLSQLAARTGCRTHLADVTDGAAMARIVDAVAPMVVICNAGRGGGFDGLANTDPVDLIATIQTNVTAVLELCRIALPGMTARGCGHLVLVGSVAALYPAPSAIYGGSKAAIRQIAQNLRLELRGTGVRVTDIRPGRVDTEFYDVAISDPAAAARAKDTRIRELQPRDVARAVLYALSAPRHVNVSSIELQPLEQTYGATQVDPVRLASILRPPDPPAADG